MSVNAESFRAVVEGVALRKRHVRRTQETPKGGVVDKEASIHISNLMIVCPRCNKSTKAGRKLIQDRMVRVCKKCGEAFAS